MGERVSPSPDISLNSVVDSQLRAVFSRLTRFEPALVIDPTKDTERLEMVSAISRFYADGCARFVSQQGFDISLPDERIWPDEYEGVYGWLRDIPGQIQGAPSLVFDELVRNAQMHAGFAGLRAAWNRSVFHLMVADHGRGMGSSTFSMDGMGMGIITSFATKDLKYIKTSRYHIVHLQRNLEKVPIQFPGIQPHLQFRHIREYVKQGIPLPQIDPNSKTYTTIDEQGRHILVNAVGEKTIIHPGESFESMN